MDENIHLNFPIEMSNNIREGLTPHEIKLKKKCNCYVNS